MPNIASQIQRRSGRNSASGAKDSSSASAPQVADLHAWMREQRARLPRGHDLVKAMDYMLKRWDRFAAFLNDYCFWVRVVPIFNLFRL